MLMRAHCWAAAAWAALATAAGLGFVARDLLGLGQPAVGLAWAAGALLLTVPALARALRRRTSGSGTGGGGESGQATVESAALALLACLSLGALWSVGPRIDGVSLGGFLAHRVACAVKGGCHDGQRALASAYGEAGAALVRAHAPSLVYEPGERQLPVDWRHCRRPSCSRGPDGPGLDVHRNRSGARATAFTHVVRRGGSTYIQYWLYYPDSNSTWAGSDRRWKAVWRMARRGGLVRATPRYPGYHPDDWETYQVRIGAHGRVWARASSHGHYQSCKQWVCRNRWMDATGWTRVSRGSHAGHIPTRPVSRGRALLEVLRALPLPGRGPPPPPRRVPALPGLDLWERTTTSEGLRLIPLELPGRRRYRAQDGGIGPPWHKPVYGDPESEDS